MKLSDFIISDLQNVDFFSVCRKRSTFQVELITGLIFSKETFFDIDSCQI